MLPASEGKIGVVLEDETRITALCGFLNRPLDGRRLSKESRIAMTWTPAYVELAGLDPDIAVTGAVLKTIANEADAAQKLALLLELSVESCFPVLEWLGERLDFLEADIHRAPTTAVISEAHVIQRELLAIRRVIWPTREAIDSLLTHTALLSTNAQQRLRASRDRTVQLLDMMETFRALCASLDGLYHAQQQHRFTLAMQKLTVGTAIFLPLNFLASVFCMNFDYLVWRRGVTGVFGMNFQHGMWALKWEYGYDMFWAISLTLIAVELLLFRYLGWFA